MSFLHSFWKILTSSNEKIYRQLGYWAATAVLYFLCAGILWVEVLFDNSPFKPVQWLSTCMLVGVSLFFILIRLSHRLHLAPSRLAVAQGVFAITLAVADYALSGPARGAMLSILLVVLVFCTFTLEAKTSRRLSLFAICLLGFTMLALLQLDPDRVGPRMELLHFGIAASTLLIVGFLTGKLSELQIRMKAQKAELADALARNRVLATQDPLTSLPNRRHMSDVLDEEERRLAAGHEACLALLDIDWFKQINDTHGHEIGDEVLRAFASQAKTTLRTYDVLARWGGEEFLLLMRNTDSCNATQVLSRLRESIAVLPDVAPRLPPVTFSAGIVVLDPAEGIANGIRRADHALYRAKSEGRNRVTVAA